MAEAVITAMIKTIARVKTSLGGVVIAKKLSIGLTLELFNNKLALLKALRKGKIAPKLTTSLKDETTIKMSKQNSW
ncbi:hypothetical protein OLK001_13200 [Synechocystis sp. LKSZ1]